MEMSLRGVFGSQFCFLSREGLVLRFAYMACAFGSWHFSRMAYAFIVLLGFFQRLDCNACLKSGSCLSCYTGCVSFCVVLLTMETPVYAALIMGLGPGAPM